MMEMSKQSKPAIVIFDMNMTTGSPAGSCVLAEINGLVDYYQIVAVTGEFHNDHPDQIQWLRVPLPRGPVLLRYLVFHALAPVVYAFWYLRGGRSDIIQATQGQFPLADITYAHFCHRAYLKNHWLDSTVSGPRRLARWLSHQFNAFFEARAFARCRMLVVPSLGLAKELAKEYPHVKNKIEVIPNPVALSQFTCPADFNRQVQRAKLGFSDNELVLSFMALGDFARKGLGLLIEALGNNLRTNIQTSEIRTLTQIAIAVKPADIKTISFISDDSRVMTTGSYGGASVVMPSAGVFNYSDIQALIKKSMSNNLVVTEAAPVVVLNGSSQSGVGQTEADK